MFQELIHTIKLCNVTIQTTEKPIVKKANNINIRFKFHATNIPLQRISIYQLNPPVFVFCSAAQPFLHVKL